MIFSYFRISILNEGKYKLIEQDSLKNLQCITQYHFWPINFWPKKQKRITTVKIFEKKEKKKSQTD